MFGSAPRSSNRRASSTSSRPAASCSAVSHACSRGTSVRAARPVARPRRRPEHRRRALRLDPARLGPTLRSRSDDPAARTLDDTGELSPEPATARSRRSPEFGVRVRACPGRHRLTMIRSSVTPADRTDGGANHRQPVSARTRSHPNPRILDSVEIWRLPVRGSARRCRQGFEQPDHRFVIEVSGPAERGRAEARVFDVRVGAEVEQQGARPVPTCLSNRRGRRRCTRRRGGMTSSSRCPPVARPRRRPEHRRRALRLDPARLGPTLRSRSDDPAARTLDDTGELSPEPATARSRRSSEIPGLGCERVRADTG